MKELGRNVTTSELLKGDEQLARARQEVFARCNNYFLEFGIPYPSTIDYNAPSIFSKNGLYISYNRIVELRHDSPRLCDLNIPQEFRALLKAYGDETGFGEKTYLRSGFDICIVLYDNWPPSPTEDKFGYNKLDDKYEEWFYNVWAEWFDWKKFSGWKVEIHKKDPLDGFSTSFKFTTNGQLNGFNLSRSSKKPEKDYFVPDFMVYAKFRNGKLVSFWNVVPNGTLFQDPKGPKEIIWPIWLRKPFIRDGKLVYDRTPAHKEHWDEYLERIRRGKSVFSPKRNWYKKISQEEAEAELEKWQQMIYYKYPQAFYCRWSNLQGAWISEMGYELSSRYGPYISKNRASRRVLSSSEAANFLLEWSDGKREPII